MKEKPRGLAMRQTYEPPCAEIFEIGSHVVLCGSSKMKGRGTEGVSVSGFDWI